MDVITMTDPTPMMMPSSESIVRVLLRRKVLNANVKSSITKFTPTTFIITIITVKHGYRQLVSGPSGDLTLSLLSRTTLSRLAAARPNSKTKFTDGSSLALQGGEVHCLPDGFTVYRLRIGVFKAYPKPVLHDPLP
jgi:hypothetical protein